jgi:PAS domain S-box-containing protein
MAVRWQRNSQLRILRQFNALLAASLDYQKALQKINEIIVPSFADYSVIHLFEENEQITPVAVAHVNPHHLETLWALLHQFPPDRSKETPASRVLRTEKPEMQEVIGNTSLGIQHPEQHMLNQILNPYAYIIVPLIARERMLGIMTMVTSVSKRRYSNQHLQVAELLAQSVALVIDNALLYEKAETELQHRQRAEDLSRQKEEQLRVVTDALPVLISYIDSQHCYQLNNNAYEAWFKLPRETIRGKHMREVLGEAAYQTILPYVEQVLSGETVHYERLVPYTTGARFISATYVPDFSEDRKVRGAFVLVNDMTERKEQESRDKLMQQLIAALSEALTPAQVTQIVVEKAMTALGGHLGVVAIVSDDGQNIKVLAPHHIPEEIYQEYKVIPINTPTLITDTVRRGQMITFETQESYITAYPLYKDVIENISKTHATIALPMTVSGKISGAILISFPAPRKFVDEDLTFLQTLTHHCAQALERTRLYEAEKESRQFSERVAERITHLQEITAALSGALTYEQVAQICVEKPLALLNACLGGLALVSADQTALHTVESFAVPHPVDEPFTYIPLHASLPLTDAVRTRTPIWIRSKDHYRELYSYMADEIEALPCEAFANLPLVVDDKIIGGISFGFEDAQTFEEDNRNFMVALAQQCAQALERARLYEAEHLARTTSERNAERLEKLQKVTAALSEALTPAEVAGVVVEQGFDILGGHSGSVAVLNEERTTLEIINHRGLPQNVFEQLHKIPTNAAAPLAYVVRTGYPVWIETLEDYVERFPDTAKSFQPYTQTQAFAAVPMIVDGKVIGVVGVSFPNPRTFTDPDKAFIAALAHQCAQALRRAHLAQQTKEAAAYEERQRLARELHDAVSQTLFSATTFSESLPLLWQRNQDRAMEQLQHVVTLNRAAMAEMRTLLLELRPESIVRTSLSKLLHQLLEAARGRRQIETALNAPENERKLDPDVHVALYRIAQEAVNNALKHSRAKRLSIDLHIQANTLTLCVRDNGLGFDLSQTAAGMGLNTMRERAESIKASLNMTSQPDKGTEVTVIWWG